METKVVAYCKSKPFSELILTVAFLCMIGIHNNRHYERTIICVGSWTLSLNHMLFKVLNIVVTYDLLFDVLLFGDVTWLQVSVFDRDAKRKMPKWAWELCLRSDYDMVYSIDDTE